MMGTNRKTIFGVFRVASDDWKIVSESQSETCQLIGHKKGERAVVTRSGEKEAGNVALGLALSLRMVRAILRLA